jgi:hypothetical protein
MKHTPRTETVSLGTEHLGRIFITQRGFETFGPKDEDLCTHVTIQAARKALFELHRDSAEGLAKA